MGLTVIVLPEPKYVPAQELEYHSHDALFPKLPPETLSKEISPGHMLLADGTIAVGAVDSANVFIVTLIQLVVLQVPSALAK